MSHTLKSCLVNWPALSYKGAEDTFGLLHMISQIIGKMKLTLVSSMNHWWHVTLHLTPSGFTSGLMHYKKLSFEIRMDLHEHRVLIETSDGEKEIIELKSMSVSDFYKDFFSRLDKLGIHVKIWGVPVEIEDRVPFEKDKKVREYNEEVVENYAWILSEVENVMEEVRSGLIGKVSPVQFFWGSFDLVLSVYSGKKAPAHPGVPNLGRNVVLEGYSHEVCSMGFWPGQGYGVPAFYSYIYPEPTGFKNFQIKPTEARYDDQLKEFILPYSAVENSGADLKLKEFFTSSLDAAFNLGGFSKELKRASVKSKR